VCQVKKWSEKKEAGETCWIFSSFKEALLLVKIITMRGDFYCPGFETG
jgi:hypothetical protein